MVRQCLIRYMFNQLRLSDSCGDGELRLRSCIQVI
jgi:hypothetical protein